MAQGSKPVLVMVEGIAADSPTPTRTIEMDPNSLKLHPLDLGLTRGDGIFESIGVISGRPLELDAHLSRLARSTVMLDFPPLRFSAIKDSIGYVISNHVKVSELLVKVFITRGPEHQPEPAAWIHAAEGPDHSRTRTVGLSVVTLNRGYPRNIAQTSPWLLQGAKTLSYAVNLAALREAARREAEEVIYISSDGYVLEGPTSTVIIRDSYGYRTPPPEDGVLPGTTQARIFKELSTLGFETKIESIHENALRSANAIWLVSSGRLVAPVRSLNESAVVVDNDMTDRMIALLSS